VVRTDATGVLRVRAVSRRRRLLAIVAAVAALIALAGCGEDTDDDVRTGTSRPDPTGTITTTIPGTSVPRSTTTADDES
jgi:hypothetical protein